MAFWLQMTWEGTALAIAGAGFFFNAGICYLLAQRAVTKADLLAAIGGLREKSDDRYVDREVCSATHKAGDELIVQLQVEINRLTQAR